MSSGGEPFRERGTYIPRIVRDNGYCLTCRRSGNQCDARLPICDTCQKNGLKCIQPISAYSEVESGPRKRQKIGAESGETSRAETRPESEAEAEAVADSEAETEILTPPALVSQPESAVQPQPQPQPQQDENDENTTSGPFWSTYMNALSRQINEAQQELLRKTPGHICHIQPPQSTPSGPLIDPDHDYAVYYDYQYDLDSDDAAVDGSNGRRSHTPYTLESTSRTSTVYQVRHTWTAKGPAPLRSRLNDFIYYMRECHLSHAPSDALPLALLPASEVTTAETLRLYILRPTNRGTNPLPDINPPNPMLVDLAYSNPLVLQLIIAERVDHREVSSATLPTGIGAEQFYRSTIGSFAPMIQGYLDGNEEDMLALTIGSLILSLTEKARLDKRGQAHNYPTAASVIIRKLTIMEHKDICKNLPATLIEYYTHTSMFACLAADVSKAWRIPFVSKEFRNVVNNLVREGYEGRLCGTWLQLMACVHSIFQLGLDTRAYANDTSGVPRPGSPAGYRPKQLKTLNWIQEKLITFRPALDITSTNFEAGVLWRNAGVLYLWSLVEWPLTSVPPGHLTLVSEKFYDEAFQRLGEIPMDSSVNKTLCWPLIILGCCAKTTFHQNMVARRLLHISNHFKIGNALETYYILRHIWAQPPGMRSPWLIHKSIRETNCWGSLAIANWL